MESTEDENKYSDSMTNKAALFQEDRKTCNHGIFRKGVSRKKWTLQYPNIPSEIRPVQHTEELPVPKIPETFSVK
ncbi:P2Y purinoceptor 12 isoform X3 [Phyllobates terribilis]|uniref:P2Y purinoceptor 12 isoform X3 n=1 Tax=Phyllobates terribilis TaxID=111132 RepID=UPI003CCB109C